MVADPQRTYDGRPQTDPVAPSGTVPNYKSGGYTDRAGDLRSASRFGFGSDLATSSDGFRLYMRFDPLEPEPPPLETAPDPVPTASLLIDTVAGGGVGDGGLATEALIGTGPYGLAIDSQDRLYIVDGAASRVRRVNLDGTIETIVGNGLFGYNGDGQQATDARLNWPSGIFIDENDRVFIADRLNHRIRVVEQVGIISTTVSPSVFGFPGTSTPIEVLDRLFKGTQTPDDIDNHLIFGPIDLDADADGALYTITGRPNQDNAQSILRISSTGSAVEMSGRSLFASTGIFPSALAATPEGRVYYTQGSSVRWVDSGGTIQTIAGAQTGTYDDNTPAMFADQSPSDIAFAPNGDVVVLDLETDRVRRIDSNGTINTIAGTGDSGFRGDGGSALQARLNTPVDAEFDSQGNLYIHDLGNRRIRKVDTNGIITTFAGGGVADGVQATQAVLQSPTSVAITENGVIYISDSGNHRIRRVDLDGVISTYAGTGKSGFDGDNGPATKARLDSPAGIDIDDAGNLYIADRDNHRVRRVSPNGIITTVAGNGDLFGSLGDGGPAVEATVGLPDDVHVSGGAFLVSDQGNRRIRRFTTGGTIETVVGTGTIGFRGDGGPATNAQLRSPAGLFVTAEGTLYFADTQNHRIRRVDPSGTITTIAGDGNDVFGGDGGPAIRARLNEPTSVIADTTGNVFIADTSNNRIRRIDAEGVITTIVGTGDPILPSGVGDGGGALQAHLTSPTDLTFTHRGSILISDFGGNRIRKVVDPVIEPPPPAFDPVDPELADFDADGEVGFPDFIAFAQAFGTTESRFDIDGDGFVGFGDFFRFATVFGETIDR